MTVYYIDHESGVNANNGQSFANRKKTYDSLGTLVANDEIRIIASPSPMSIGIGQWTNNSNLITFGTPLPVTVIEDGETVWTAATNVTATRTAASALEGVNGVNLSIAAAFTTGKAAYRRVANPSTGAIANRAASLLGAASLTAIVTASADTALQTLTLPFQVFYNGAFFNQVTVSSNSWLVFGSTATQVSSAFTASNPAFPTLMIGTANNSWQRLYAGAENGGTTYRIRFEGTNATSGVVGSPTIVWEVTFDQATPGTINIDIGSNTYIASSVSGVSDGMGNFVYAISPDNNTGYTITQAVSPLDLSTYDTVSLAWGGTVPFMYAYLALCSDLTGDVVVETIPFNTNMSGADATTNTPVTFQPVVYNKGSALSNSIQSIAIYLTTDPGASTTTLFFDNVIATTQASGVNHANLIGKNTVNESWFYNIKAIKPGSISIGYHLAALSDQVSQRSRPYFGTTEAVTTYMQPITWAPYLSALRTLAGNATLASITGGWSRTDMSTRTGRTYIRMWGGTTGYIVAGSRVVNYLSGITMAAAGGAMVGATSAAVLTCDDLETVSCDSADILFGGASYTTQYSWKIKSIVQSSGWTIPIPNNGILTDVEVDTITGSYSTAYSVRTQAGSAPMRSSRRPRPIKINRIQNSHSFGVGVDSDIRYRGITFEGNRTADVSLTGGGLAEFLECGPFTVSALTATNVGMVTSKDGFTVYGGSGVLQSAVIHATPTALRLSPTNAAITSLRPLIFSVGEIAVSSGVPITVTAWSLRDNAGITMGMLTPGGIISGIETDVTSTVSGVDVWEQLTLTVTPTVDGILEIWAYAYGGTTFNGYITELAWST